MFPVTTSISSAIVLQKNGNATIRFTLNGCSLHEVQARTLKTISVKDDCFVPDVVIDRFFCWTNYYVLKIKDLNQGERLSVSASIYPWAHCSISLLFYIAFLKIAIAKNNCHLLDPQIKMATKELFIPFRSGSHSMFFNIVSTWLHPSNLSPSPSLLQSNPPAWKSVESQH